jgi:hypothetical protein
VYWVTPGFFDVPTSECRPLAIEDTPPTYWLVPDASWLAPVAEDFVPAESVDRPEARELAPLPSLVAPSAAVERDFPTEPIPE